MRVKPCSLLFFCLFLMDKQHYATTTYIVIKAVEKELKGLTRITVSFKQTTRDMKLYTMVKNLEEQSDFIKNAIENYIKFIEGDNNAKTEQY